MRVGVLPGLSRTVPPLIVGTGKLGSMLPGLHRDRDFAFLDGVRALGLTAFDTAAVYQGGGSERTMGAWIRTRNNRNELFLISKGLHPGRFTGCSRFHASALRRDVEGSLRRLGVDQIDLYLLHRDSPEEPFEPVMDELAHLVKTGKLAAFGVSNWSHARLGAARRYCTSRGQPQPVASSPHFSLLQWVKVPWPGCISIAGPAGSLARAYYTAEQVPVLAWSPLGSGFFSLRNEIAHGTACQLVYGSEANRLRRLRVNALAARRGVPASAVALAYVLGQPFPSSVIVAASSVERMAENLRAVDLQLSPDELRELEVDDAGVSG